LPAFSEEVEFGAAVHLASGHFQAVDVSFDGAGVVVEGEAVADGVVVASDAGDEGVEFGSVVGGDLGHPGVEFLTLAGGEDFREGDDMGGKAVQVGAGASGQGEAGVVVGGVVVGGEFVGVV
jgi:hypothetical protein